MKWIVAALTTLLALILSPIAEAQDWYLAETENFRLYSKDGEDETREFAEDLERLDQAMRILSGVGPAKEPLPDYSKVTVFRFGEGKDLGNLVGARNVGGFFIGRAGQPVAFVPRRANRVRGLGQKATGLELDPRGVIFHEYAHYFMYYHAPAAYPAWYTEGFAELFYTIELDDERFTIGEPPSSRAIELGALRAETRKMFDPDPKGERGGRDIARIYGHGWLLSSYLLLSPDRRGQLNRYLVMLNEGRDSLEAAEEVFGDLDELDKELNKYRGERAQLLKVPYYDASTPEVDIRPLTRAEEEIMDMVIRSKVGVDEDMAAKQLDDARAVAAKYPDSVPVLKAAMEVEFDNKNWDEAEAMADRILAIDEDNMEALIYRAEVSMARGADDPEHYLEARRRFIAANRVQGSNPRALFGFYRSFFLADDVLTDNATLALSTAYFEATYDAGLRAAVAHWLLSEERDDEALAVLMPTINNPHSQGGQKLREMLDSGTAEDREKLMGRLQPRPYGYEPPEDEDDDA